MNIPILEDECLGLSNCGERDALECKLLTELHSAQTSFRAAAKRREEIEARVPAVSGDINVMLAERQAAHELRIAEIRYAKALQEFSDFTFPHSYLAAALDALRWPEVAQAVAINCSR